VDCVHDQLADGRRIWILNIAGDHSHLCVGQRVELCIAGARLARWLDESGESRGLPRTLVLNNGPKMTSKALFFWSQRSGVTLDFIYPGQADPERVVGWARQRTPSGRLSEPALV